MKGPAVKETTVRHRRLRNYLDAVGVFVCELALFAFFWKSAPFLGSVDFGHFGNWLGSTNPSRALSALVRLLGLGISAWLVCSTMLYAVASLRGHKGLLGRSRHVTPPFVRRVVDALAAATVAASTIGTVTVGTGAAGAFASPPPTASGPSAPVVARPASSQGLSRHRAPVASVHELAATLARAPSLALTKTRVLGVERMRLPAAGRSGMLAPLEAVTARVSSTVVGRHFPHPGDLAHLPPPRAPLAPARGVVPSAENGFAGLPRGTRVVVVQPGDCLSVIAQRYLGDWRLDTEIEALNFGRPQPDGLALVDDHWIYPGWVLIMPDNAVGTIVVGEPASSVEVETRGEHRDISVGEVQAERPSVAGRQAPPPGGASRRSVSREFTSSEARQHEPAQHEPAQHEPAQHEPAQHEPAQHRGAAPEASSPTERARSVGDAPARSKAVPRSIGRSQLAHSAGDERQHARHAAPPPSSPPTSATGAAVGPGIKDVGHEAPSLVHRDVVAEALGLGGIGAVAAAGVVWRIQRSRREQGHSRRKGWLPAKSRAPVQAAERRARAVASGEAMRWVDLGLRYLGALVEQAARDAATGGTFSILPGYGSVPQGEQAGRSAQGLPGASNEDGAAPVGALAADDGSGGDTGQDCAGRGPDAFERWWSGTAAASPARGQHRNGNVPPATGTSVNNDACIPSLVMMRVGATGMEVVLSPAPKGRFGWFSLKDDGTAHVLDSEIGLEDLEALASERWPAWPALVALGEAEGSTVLLNLEHAGSLAVEGPPERVSATLGAIVLQLATQPWADEMLGGLYTVGDTPLRGQLAERVQHVDGANAMDLAERLDGIASARQELAGAALLSTMRAVACEALPNVAVAFSGTPANALRCLTEAAVPERSGVALVAAGPVAGAAWRLSLEGARAAVLHGPGGEVADVAMAVGPDGGLARGTVPGQTSLTGEQAGEGGDEVCTRGRELEGRVAQEIEGVELAPSRGRQAGTGEVRVELMSAFDSEEVVLLSEAVGGAKGEELIDITAGPSGNGPRAEIPRRDVEVRLLGPVDVAGGDLGAVDRSRVMAALGVLAYLAAHPRPVPAEELAGALWPLDATKDNYGGPQRKTVMNAISRARAALGYGVNGKERLVLTPQGYCLSDEVGSDWERFQRHVSTARMLGGAEAIVHLRSALELVRGEPFGGALASQFFEWVASEHLDMTLSAHAVDVAQDLGELALAAGDFAAVYWAVDKGLALEPTREELFRLWMHALGREGRPAKVDDVYRRLKLVLRQRVHPLHEPQRESWEVWRSYTAVESVAGGRPGEW